MQVWNVLHAARCKHRTQKLRQNGHLRTIAQLFLAITSQLRHLPAIGKKLVKPHVLNNMVDFGPLADEIASLVWGTPANFNRFRAYSQPSHIGCIPYFHTRCGLNANLGCISENVLHAAPWNTARQRLPKIRQLRTIAQRCRAIRNWGMYRQSEKKLVKYLPHVFLTIMVNFGALAAEMVSLLWAPQLISTGFASWQRYCTALW